MKYIDLVLDITDFDFSSKCDNLVQCIKYIAR